MESWGFKCVNTIGEKSKCTETVAPYLKLRRITDTNQIFLVFSENITISEKEAMTESNLKLEIKGPLAPYGFEFRIVQFDIQPLIPEKNISWFVLDIFNIKQTLYG